MLERIVVAVLVLCLIGFAGNGFSYTINDPPDDAFMGNVFETYGANISNIYSAPIVVDLFTNFPNAEVRAQTPADLFLYETRYGIEYPWAVPLVSHDVFTRGSLYPVGTTTPNFPVNILTKGNNYGWVDAISTGTVDWITLSPGNPNFDIRIVLTSFYETDPNGSLRILWGTATCANDILEGSTPPSSVPEPTTLLLVGSGLFVIARKLRRS
jgi:hypothetical protein